MSTATTTEIRVLSIRQPFVDWILMGHKWAENRSWRSRYRGPLYLHSSRWQSGAEEWWEEMMDSPMPESEYQTGAILGVVDFVDVVTARQLGEIEYPRLRARLPEEQAATWDWCDQQPDPTWEHVSGPNCFIFQDPKKLITPIETGGKLNVWKHEVDESALALA